MVELVAKLLLQVESQNDLSTPVHVSDKYVVQKTCTVEKLKADVSSVSPSSERVVHSDEGLRPKP